VVGWIDEKFPIQALGHIAPILPVRPGHIERQTIERQTRD
jgi:hypothetical protein